MAVGLTVIQSFSNYVSITLAKQRQKQNDVEFTRSGSKCLVTIHKQHRDTPVKSIQELFAATGIKGTHQQHHQGMDT